MNTDGSNLFKAQYNLLEALILIALKFASMDPEIIYPNFDKLYKNQC
jgi:hypothetical protein